jgi:cytochrome P450
MTDTVAARTPDTQYPFAPMPAHDASEQYRRIAQDRPMTRVTMPFGGSAWVIHRNKAAREMLADRRFVRRPFRTGERAVPYFVDFPDFLKATIQFADPPEHTKLRRLVQGAISPRRVHRMRDSAIAYANVLLDDMIAAGPSANLVPSYAVPIPMQMLCNLLGVPMEDRRRFEGWASSTLAVANMDEQLILENMTELYGYMWNLVQLRRQDPKDDLISSLANARDKDDTLADEEILSVAMVLLIAGFDNTANFICTGVLSLLRNPDQRELFISDIDGLAPTAAEEVLRHGMFASGLPVAGSGGLVPFVATQDIEIDGQVIMKDEAVLIDPAAVAHDGIALTDGERFDIARTDNPHLTLSYGIHHCLGAPLARMELQVALAEVFKRLPRLELAGEAVINHDHLSRPITELPVAW